MARLRNTLLLACALFACALPASGQVSNPPTRVPTLTVTPGDTTVEDLTVNGTCTGCGGVGSLSDDNTLVGNGSSVATATAIPDCSNGALGYTQSTNTFSCTVLATGTWTPTLTTDTNLDAAEAFVNVYSRVGDTVTVSITLRFDPTSSGSILSSATLPIASDFDSDKDAHITCGQLTGSSGDDNIAGYGDPTNDRITFSGYAAHTNIRFYVCSGQYIIK